MAYCGPRKYLVYGRKVYKCRTLSIFAQKRYTLDSCVFHHSSMPKSYVLKTHASVSQNTELQESESWESESEESAPEESTPADSAPEESAPEESAPTYSKTENSTPIGSESEESGSEESESEESTLKYSKTENSAHKDSASEQSDSEQSESEQSEFEQSESEHRECKNCECENGECENGECKNGECENGECENGDNSNTKVQPFPSAANTASMSPMKTSHTDTEPSLSKKQDDLLQSLAIGHSQNKEKDLEEYMLERKTFCKQCLKKLMSIENKRAERGFEERSEQQLVEVWRLDIERRWKKYSVKHINMQKYPIFDVHPIMHSMN